MDRIAITGGDIRWLDQAAGLPEHPAQLQLAQLQVDAAGLVLPMDKPVRFSGSGVLTELSADEALAQSSAATAGQAGEPTPAKAAPAAPATPATNASLTSVAQQAASAAPGAVPASALASSRAQAAPMPAQAASGSVPVMPATAGVQLPPVPAITALADLPTGGLSFAGEATQTTATVQTHVQTLPLALALPYLRSMLRPQLAGALSSSSALQWQAANAKGEGGDMRLQVAQLLVQDFALQPAGDKAPVKTTVKAVSAKASKNTGGNPPILPSIKQIELSDLEVLPLTQQVKLGKLAITEPQVQVTRNAKGQLMYEDWLVPAPAQSNAEKTGASSDKASKPWQVALGELQLKGGQVGWRDEVPERAVDATLSELNASVKGFELNGKQPMQVQLASRLAAGRTGSPEVMHHHYQFMARLQQAIALQTGTLDLHVRQIEERAVALRNAEARLGSLKQVLQRRVQEQQVHERRAEQKQVDEIAALQYRKLTRGQLAGGF